MTTLDRAAYARIFGPTTGDLVRLADSDLLIEIEHDYTRYGYELLSGAGKSMRDGEGYRPTSTSASGELDFVICNATIIDAVLGIVKADIGIRDGLIVGVGKAGNPDMMPGVHPDLIVGHTTTPIQAEGCIVTAGAIESHAHLMSPEQSDHALATGTTTIIGGSPGPIFEVGSGNTNNLGRFLQGAEFSCLNFMSFGRGASVAESVEASVAAGAGAVKIHEDFGAAPAVIDQSLRAADRNDFAVHLHTDSINEFGYVETTMAAIGDRTIHMYHVEGAGGGHAPDILRVVGFNNVIPASTNPSNPFTPNALEEGVPMTMIVHLLNPLAPEDVAFAETRIRPQTMIAEDYLHDSGAISIFGTDSQGMGRLAENVANCWQLAAVMKDRVGRLAEETTTRADNERVKRYIAKYTINPAIAVGIDQHIGSLEVGKVADIVLWPRASFGVKPSMVIKSGYVAWAAAGDAAGSLVLSEPVMQRPSWGALGSAPAELGINFMSALAVDAGVTERLGLRKRTVQITSTRQLRKSDMVRNSTLPEIEIDPRTFDVRADGVLLHGPAALSVPFSRKFLLR